MCTVAAVSVPSNSISITEGVISMTMSTPSVSFDDCNMEAPISSPSIKKNFFKKNIEDGMNKLVIILCLIYVDFVINVLCE